MGLIDQIIGVESGGNPNATNPNSSAMGLGQFINSTWLDTIKSARPDLVQGKSDQELLALRADPQLSREMTAAYAAKNGQTLTQAGHEATPGNTYLAHFAGPKGAVSVLSADPSASVASILGPEVIKANPFLAKMTAGDLRAWADRKMGGSTPAPQPAPATPAAAPGAPLQIAPQGNGLLGAPSSGGLLVSGKDDMGPAQAGYVSGRQPQGQPGGLMATAQLPEPPAMQPYLGPQQQRRPVDLSRLRAQLQAPIFRG